MSPVGFDLAVYIIGALIIWRFVVMGEDRSPNAVITSESASTGILGRLMPTVFTPEGWGNLGTTIQHLHRNR